MPQQLNKEQLRVLGCLLEKAVTTPDQYPMTLNALVNACNQKSSRDPVMQLEPGQVERTLNELKDHRMVVEDENFRSRVQKFSQRFCGTPFSDYQFDAAQYAVICLLFLRGPQTPGEFRSRSGRLHSFADNADVRATLDSLMQWEGGALVARLPKQAGRQDHEYMHLFGDRPVAADSGSERMLDRVAPEPTSTTSTSTPPEIAVPNSVTGQETLVSRVAALESKVAALEARLATLSPD